MDEPDWLTERFEGHRPRLRAVAYRMLGWLSEADDTVQEAWLRLNRTDTGQVDNLGGWLTTVVVALRTDLGPLPTGGSREVRGAEAVAGQAVMYSRLGLIVQPALVNGAPGWVTIRDGQRFSVVGVTVKGGKIVEIDILADPARLRRLDLTLLER